MIIQEKENKYKSYDRNSRRVWNCGNFSETRRPREEKSKVRKPGDYFLPSLQVSFHYTSSFQTDIFKVCFVIFSFFRKIGKNSGLVSNP